VRPAISIDVGGTFTKSAVVDVLGEVLCELAEPTATALAPTGIADHVANLVGRLLAAGGFVPRDVAGACVGLPGIVEHRLGQALSCPNLRNWEGLPLAELVTARAGITTYVERDANLAALGESWVGVARGTA
jgi:glucokinase